MKHADRPMYIEINDFVLFLKMTLETIISSSALCYIVKFVLLGESKITLNIKITILIRNLQ